jgi:MFS family permease
MSVPSFHKSRTSGADETTSHNVAPTISGGTYATAVLFVTNLVGYMDRSILTLLVQPVKQTLGLSDGEIGLMQGAAFVLTFSIAGLFIGPLIDRRNRRNLLIACVAIWSFSAAACGLAQTGWHLFLGRMGVGVGEAALIPAAVSLIADYFAPERRGKPYGFFTMGVYAGSGLSLILVAFALPSMTLWSQDLASQGVTFEPWRMVMVSMLLPGLLSCLALATMREPARQQLVEPHAPDQSGFSDWLARKNVLLPHHLAIAFGTVGLFATTAWMPTILIREHAFEPRDAGLLFGSMIAVVGVGSAAAAGMLSDYANRRYGPPGRMLMAVACMLVGLLGFIILHFATTPTLLIVASALVFSPMSMTVVTGIMALSDLSPARARGLITSIYFIFAGAIANAGGPALVGYLNDELSKQGTLLSTVLSLTGIASILLALGFAALTLVRMRLGAQRPARM